MLTLALTVVVPDTVEPWVGDVMVTIRLPTNWAEAGCGDIDQPTRTVSRAASTEDRGRSVSARMVTPLVASRATVRMPWPGTAGHQVDARLGEGKRSYAAPGIAARPPGSRSTGVRNRSGNRHTRPAPTRDIKGLREEARPIPSRGDRTPRSAIGP